MISVWTIAGGIVLARLLNSVVTVLAKRILKPLEKLQKWCEGEKNDKG